MNFNAHQFREFLKSSNNFTDIVELQHKGKSNEYAYQQALLIDSMHDTQLTAIHNYLTHPDTEKNPVTFYEIDPISKQAILREANGMKIFITPSGECNDSFFN